MCNRMQLNVRWGMQRLVGSTAQQRMVAATGSRSTQQATGSRQEEHEATGNQQAELQQLINPQTNGSKCWTIVSGNCHLYPTSAARAASLPQYLCSCLTPLSHPVCQMQICRIFSALAHSAARAFSMPTGREASKIFHMQGN